MNKMIKPLIQRPVSSFFATMACLWLTSCQSVYYKMWDTVGVEKRELLQKHVENVVEDQTAVNEEFKDTLEKIRSEYKPVPGKLDEVYDSLSDDYDSIKSKHETLKSREEKVNRIAQDLFEEWESEAQTFKNSQYRKDSLNKLQLAKKKYKDFQSTLAQTVKKIDPLLAKLNDQVLYLKHNLNAKAVGVLGQELLSIESEMKQLVIQIYESIDKSKKFSQTLS